MQITLLRVPMPGKQVQGKGYAHKDLLCIQFRSGKSPDDAAVEVAVESLCITANEAGQIIQVTLPADSIGKRGSDPRMEMALAKLFGQQFAQWLSKKADQKLSWESGPHQQSLPRASRKDQGKIVFWLDAKSKELKKVRLAEFLSCTDWSIATEDEGSA